MQALGLSERQLQVLRLIVEGLGNRDIARRLDIAENTVKQHIQAVFAALKVDSRSKAIAVAARHGIKSV